MHNVWTVEVFNTSPFEVHIIQWDNRITGLHQRVDERRLPHPFWDPGTRRILSKAIVDGGFHSGEVFEPISYRYGGKDRFVHRTPHPLDLVAEGHEEVE